MNLRNVSEFPGFVGHDRTKTTNRHAVILAGGDGSRLRQLTLMIAGDERPKQFCPIIGDKTLLDRTRERIGSVVLPENTLFSLTKKHEAFYRNPLWNVPLGQMVVQPENRGTASAILYALLRLVHKDPQATVAFFPSDHYFSDDAAFMEHVETAYRAAELNTDSVVLLGIEPEKPETAYGWIEPENSFFGEISRSVSRVKRFWEKPSSGSAKKLMTSGCLWNSFVMVGKAEAFLQLFRTHLPELYRVFAAARLAFGRPLEESVIRSVYSWIADYNFSSDVLEKATDNLMVMRVNNVGWCDWGEPQRVIGTLADLGIRPEWAHGLTAY